MPLVASRASLIRNSYRFDAGPLKFLQRSGTDRRLVRAIALGTALAISIVPDGVERRW
jgi:hypothetical protein